MKHINSFVTNRTFRVLFYFTLSLFLWSCKKEKSITDDTQQNTNFVLGLVETPSSIYSLIPSAPTPAPSGNLPSSFILEIPSNSFNQGQQGSCVSCASAMTKSILDHVKYNTAYPNNGIIYSPSYLFNQVHLDPNNCAVGSYVYSNLEIMKTQGICKLTEMSYNQSDCNTQPTNSQMSFALPNKINHYFKIDPISILWIKEFIHIGHAVIVAFQVDDYFMNSNSTTNNLWNQFGPISRGYHAALLYGWDDSRNAFKMLNSWGNSWGNNGTLWVDYNFVQNGASIFYGKIFREAYIIQNPNTTTNNPPVADFDLNGGSASINVGDQVNFRDLSSNSPTSWVWTFPGGNPSSSNFQSPAVTYNAPGTYNVTLKATNSSGSNTLTRTAYINVSSTTSLGTFTMGLVRECVANISRIQVNWTTSANATSYDIYRNNSIYRSNFIGNQFIDFTISPGITYNYYVVAKNSTSSISNSNGILSTTAFNCGPLSFSCGQPFTDPRDGNTYATININGQCWMAENLRFTNNGSLGLNYNNSTSNYNTFGRLYSFSEVLAGNIAPNGWHIPTQSEIMSLNDYIFSNYNNYGGALKSTSNLWAPPNTGADNATGFTALPSGRYFNGQFEDLGFSFYMWSSTSQSSSGLGSKLRFNGDGFGGGSFSAGYYFAIRCVKD